MTYIDENRLPTTANTDKTGESESTLSYPNTPAALHSMHSLAKHVSEKLTVKDMRDVFETSLHLDPQGHSMMLTQVQLL